METCWYGWQLSHWSIFVHGCYVHRARSNQSVPPIRSRAIQGVQYRKVIALYVYWGILLAEYKVYENRFEKRSNFTHLNANNWQYCSNELETHYDNPMIILQHSLGIPNPAHFLCGCGRHAYYPLSKSSHFIPLVWQPPLLTRGYLHLKTWDSQSRRPDVPNIKGPHCFEMVMAWKVPKFGILCEVAPFLKSTHILYYYCTLGSVIWLGIAWVCRYFPDTLILK